MARMIAWRRTKVVDEQQGVHIVVGFDDVAGDEMAQDTSTQDLQQLTDFLGREAWQSVGLGARAMAER